MGKKILLIGGGGREHAIAWKLAQSPQVDEIVCAPGNAGIAQVARCVDGADAEDVSAMARLAEAERPDLVVIGPEVPLALGLTDMIEAQGIPVFGPNKKCSQLEASKSFTKDFLIRHGIPTAKSRVFTDKNELLQNRGLYGYPMVLKADGLAAGKGVVLAADEEEARRAIEDMMGSRVFGEAGDTVVVEECLTGVEASVLCFVDGSAIVPMESAQDYKRIFDGDKGPNTGGMGTYSPSLVFTDELNAQIRERVLGPTFSGFKEDGLDFRGVLFIGLMITDEGPKVIEFNNRFGDPETQSVLRRLESDLLDIFVAVTEDRLAEQHIEWSEDRAVCVVLSSAGYPGSYEKGKKVTGLDRVDEGIVVFHAGTKPGAGGEILTNGGRVLGVTATGGTHDEARAKAYANAEKIKFDGVYYRKDIGVVYYAGAE
ncbi:MAG: phosphoribosylamine--glycine ligase [Clostridiales Family XIII bacterium]|jgi:phosphoribosylamine--glycine ligase|nr:phosphoribosylamine--glycine ligase [Clostridiales Family XIII bacterium]